MIQKLASWMLPKFILYEEMNIMKTALLSVWNKTGVTNFAKRLHDAGWWLIASGGTDPSFGINMPDPKLVIACNAMAVVNRAVFIMVFMAASFIYVSVRDRL